MSIKSLRKETFGYNKDVYFYFTIFFTISLVVFLAQNFLPPSEFLDGLFIPDVVNISNTMDNIKEGASTLSSTKISGVYYIYFAAWLTHPALSFLINLILIYYAIKFTCDIFVVNNLASSRVCLGVIVNPYIFLAVTGPNKEIPLLFGTLFIVRSLIFRQNFWFLKSILLSVIIVFIRDGYGVILLFSILLYTTKLSLNFIWKIGIFVSFVASLLFELILSKFSIIERNIMLAKTLYKGVESDSAFVGDIMSNSSNPILSILKQIIRMVYNWLTLSVFPVLETPKGNIYCLGYSYWIFGIIISIAILSCIYILQSKNQIILVEKQKKIIAGIVVIIWATTSVSLFIQPRYLMPILPLAFGILMSLKRIHKRIIITTMVTFSLIIILFYMLMGNPPAKVKELSSISSSFLINTP